MPFEPTPADLKKLVFRALTTEDFSDGLEQAGLTPEKLLVVLEPKIAEMWEAGASKQIEVDKLQREYDSKLDEKVTKSLDRERMLLSLFLRLRGLMLVLPAFYLILWYLQVKRYNLWIITDRTLVQAGVAFLIFFAVLYGFYNSRKTKYESDKSIRRDQFAEENHFVDLKKNIVQAETLRDETVITQGIKPQIREILAARFNLPFSDHLPKLDFSGLSEVFNTANEIATDAKRELQFMLNTMPGGSIGIAGPRGSGKSTLLKSACADLPDNLEKRRVIPLLTTSPVEYQGRDFILHLFSSMCGKVLEITRGRTTQSAWDEVAELRRPETVSIFRTLWPLALPAFILGISLIAFSILLAVLMMNSPPSPSAAGDPTIAQGTEPGVTPANRLPSPTPAASPIPTPRAPLVVRVVRALDLKPGMLFISGLLMVLFYLVMRYYMLGVHKFNQRYAYRWPVLIHGLDLDSEIKERLGESSEEARKWLREIKFQQSYTSGWSGSLKLPIGLEGGINTAVSLAQQQLTMPDITGAFCGFLSGLGRDFKIIIGIDELDKLESDEAAQRFLNEIKAVFGISNVFYLISVSENAMSSFERRGLPFRDVFDSSFDNIIYVDYLKLEQAKRLIARRVAAMPPPFIHLCYCISGGLARDLVRVCRSLMQHANKAHALDPSGRSSNLQNLSKILIKSDLGLKLHALTVVAKKLPPGNTLSAFLDKVHSLEGKLESPQELLDAYVELLKGAKPSATDEAETNGANGLVEVYNKLKQRLSGDVLNNTDGKILNSLHEELASYIYYCVTVLEFFCDKLDATKLEEGEKRKVFDQLARARQYLSINPSITRSTLDKFRQDFEMEIRVIIPTASSLKLMAERTGLEPA